MEPVIGGTARARDDETSAVRPARVRRPPADDDLLEGIAGRLGLPVAGAVFFDVLHRGDDHYAKLLDAIAGAGREVAIEMYQIRPDDVGVTVAAALVRAAARGVRVRLLADAWGSSRFAGWLDVLRAAGAEARWYRPWRPWNNPLRRTHRKLIVIDGAVASIGGMNLGCEFSESLSRGRSWCDVSVWLGGPVVDLLAAQFEATWTGCRSVPAAAARMGGGERSRCAVAGGACGSSGHADAYRALADSASRELLIATPYFIPDAGFRTRLVAAVGRGVRVTVVVPRSPDIPPFKHAARRLFQGLLDAGVRIAERRDRMVHAKVVVVDRLVAAVGSTNVNRLSFYCNSEATILTDDRRVVDHMTAFIVDESCPRAEFLTRSSWTTHPARRKFAEFLAAPVSALF
ncbi:MAG TPA: phospholipase D-like domain-containing protein [Thermoanaerobaculaceae bacterium]|nr:phospholipase D-like domain-containing protein [Thermoanaerobaculaceae bacterium]